ncbi:hypothetical protein APR12_002806 [Nocardia amikacinitolerans]|uniref:hypothetical protein n=1 Tax=Nocardia amikacinitolerans TaxID=756689 RepID=UPI000ACA768E|nr:hypothetical protein [Nocardia amikacinitolerans]MCP2317460.1 hypothetical protein [Nocardia amikacinitolerans]
MSRGLQVRFGDERLRDADGRLTAIATARLVGELSAERDRIDRAIADLIRAAMS